MKVANLLESHNCGVAGVVAMINRRGTVSEESGRLPLAEWLVEAGLTDRTSPCSQCTANVPYDQIYGHGRPFSNEQSTLAL